MNCAVHAFGAHTPFMVDLPDEYDASAAARRARLALLREAFGLSKSELARMIGTSPQVVGNWENSEIQAISVEGAMAVQRVFNVPLDWMLAGIESSLSQPVAARIKAARARAGEKPQPPPTTPTRPRRRKTDA